MLALNLGCNLHKLPGFVNIDIDPANKPDVVMDIRNIREHYGENTVDAVYAGHFFEHISALEGIELMKNIRHILKPWACTIITVPDYVKATNLETIENAERIILNYGNHVALYNLERLENLAKMGGFKCYAELPLDRVPYILVPNIYDPKPEPWQTSLVAIKT